ncbi:alpha/beta fold hydrolase [Stappia indica]|uniref:Pimeloyl-ACP methyl ester carboxylesterase n=1 Tax=Stappia indica TaxID=538381 RepID=A0A285TS40_9HYPH|nr:alpha/beta fold hydrolase [Stappia indica]SOC26557.1 Pimeloyl-ACP methyl ester carboxylesterase [Stappia indica]
MDPLVLVPGLLCTEALFAPQIGELARDGVQVQVADHRQDETIAAIATRLLAEAPPRFALAGLSMGGYIAMEVMRRAPERVTRLMLLDTSARADTAEQTANRRRLIGLAESGKFDQVTPSLFPLFVHEDRQEDAALRQLVMQMAQATGPEAFVRQEKAILAREDSRPSLGNIPCPTTIVVGAGDRLTPPELAREMQGLIPRSRLETVFGAGHLPTVEAPDAVTALMRTWLSA